MVSSYLCFLCYKLHVRFSNEKMAVWLQEAKAEILVLLVWDCFILSNDWNCQGFVFYIQDELGVWLSSSVLPSMCLTKSLIPCYTHTPSPHSSHSPPQPRPIHIKVKIDYCIWKYIKLKRIHKNYWNIWFPFYPFFCFVLKTDPKERRWDSGRKGNKERRRLLE